MKEFQPSAFSLSSLQQIPWLLLKILKFPDFSRFSRQIFQKFPDHFISFLITFCYKWLIPCVDRFGANVRFFLNSHQNSLTFPKICEIPWLFPDFPDQSEIPWQFQVFPVFQPRRNPVYTYLQKFQKILWKYLINFMSFILKFTVVDNFYNC